MEGVDLKAALIENLNNHLDGSVHSVPELSYRYPEQTKGGATRYTPLCCREVSGKQGGLCGVAAIYQALEDTILTTSALARMDYDGMRELIQEELNLEKSTLADMELLDQYHKCVWS